jgi:hypothetical protein
MGGEGGKAKKNVGGGSREEGRNITSIEVNLVLLSLYAEAGGSDVNPNHEPHCPRGGLTAEMQVSIN